jgi:hypothetical protein
MAARRKAGGHFLLLHEPFEQLGQGRVEVVGEAGVDG